MDLSQFVEQWQNVSVEECIAVTETLTGRFRVSGPGQQDLQSSVRVGIAMERLVESLSLDGLCFLARITWKRRLKPLRASAPRS